MKPASSRDALRQLDQFWSMLDELSENDPAAYRTLIDKQMKEGAEYNSPPEIHTSLRTDILVGFRDPRGRGRCYSLVPLCGLNIPFQPTQVRFISDGCREGAQRVPTGSTRTISYATSNK